MSAPVWSIDPKPPGLSEAEDAFEAARYDAEDKLRNVVRIEFIAEAKAWLLRAKTTSPGLTNAEVELVELLISDLESP